MGKHPKEILAMTDDDLMEWTLSGEGGSNAMQWGQAAMNMRNSLKMLEATRLMSDAARDSARLARNMYEAADKTAHSTRNVAWATWAVALITLATQAAVIFHALGTWPGKLEVPLPNFLFSVLSSLVAIGALYGLYLASARYARRHIAKAECWWLPGANTFRFVIRNIPRKANLFGIRYRAWLRKDVPKSTQLSVRTFLDTEIAQGERLLLPGRQDQPVICFRLDDSRQSLQVVVTDKMGNPLRSWPIDDEMTSLMVEFSVRVRSWLLFKHEISRLYTMPQFRLFGGHRQNVFREYLLPMQASGEQEMKSVLQYTEEVTVTI